jgi:alkenylglycerophosphocholine/alkenylglycerophosphoethanolamine hydrolase
MINPFVIAAAASATAAIAAEWGGRRHRSFYVLKPLTTLLIIGIAATWPRSAPEAYRALVIAALVLSTAGDVSLMFKGNAWFMGGLGSFLVAHVLFVAAFVQGLPHFWVPLYAWLVIPYGASLLWFLLPHAGSLRVPVIVYCGVIAAMVLAAAARHAGLDTPATSRALVGALLFLASDSLLARRQFIGAYAGAQPLILSTYWAAIGLIATSV